MSDLDSQIQALLEKTADIKVVGFFLSDGTVTREVDPEYSRPVLVSETKETIKAIKALINSQVIEELENYKWHKPNNGQMPDFDYIHARIKALSKDNTASNNKEYSSNGE